MEMTLIQVKVNGKNQTLPSGMTILAYLKNKKFNPNVVACELNLKILKRNQLDQIILKEGDDLEVLQMIGGG